MNEARIKGLLGLAQRAGKLISGDDAVKRQLKKGRTQLLILAEDASPRTKDDIVKITSAIGCPVIQYASKAELGIAIGKPDRAVLLIQDRGFIERISALLGERE